MTILLTAMALAASPATAAVQPAQAAAPAMHAQHAPLAQHAQHALGAQSGPAPKSAGCACCKDMAGAAKMDCCAKHGEGHDAKHDRHSDKR